MKNSLTAGALHNANISGEVITVIYEGGLEPGTARNISVVSLAPTYARVREAGEELVKTYLIERISIPTDLSKVQWKDTEGKRKRATKLDPIKTFRHWAYKVENHHWPIFGIGLRDYVNKEQTESARLAAKEKGLTPAEVIRIKIYDQLWTKTAGTLDLCEGDTFWAGDNTNCLQVIALKDQVELHQTFRVGGRSAYLVPYASVPDWLEHGIPSDARRIPPAMSNSETLRFYLTPP